MSAPCLPLESIVDLTAIGQSQNPRNRQKLLLQAGEDRIGPASEDTIRTLLLLVDPQQDFMEDGSLGVPGSHADMARTIRFLYGCMDRISQICVSLDTHDPHQIFHPCWWVDPLGRHAPAFTTIHAADVMDGHWLPVFEPERSLRYVQALERESRKELVVWPYHCLQGTTGAAMENQLANLVYYHAVARQAPALKIAKGMEPLTEMYGIFQPEFEPSSSVNTALLDELAQYDRILVAGQAKSHCVMASVEQFLVHFAARPEITARLYLLEDCMSVIPGFEATTEATFARWARDHKVNRTSTQAIGI